MFNQEYDSLQRQLEQYHKNLLHLQEQKALYSLNVPLEILNGIDNAQVNIERIEQRLQEINEQLAHLSSASEVASQPPSKPETLPQQKLVPLKEALAHHSLALFIGSDHPREVTGLPSRADLAQELARRYELDETLSLAEVAQRVSRAGNRWEFTDFLRHTLDTTGFSPQPFHEQVAALVKTHQPGITLITVAYDNMLEIALERAGIGFNRVVRSSQLHFLNRNRSTLLKLYGDVQEPDTLVVTDQDHTNLLRNQDKVELVDEVKRAFRDNTILFLGYNLADPDFRFLFAQIAENNFARTAYAFWPGLSEVDERMWRERGIVILDANPLPALI
jgi:hypothetical protein